MLAGCPATELLELILVGHLNQFSYLTSLGGVGFLADGTREQRTHDLLEGSAIVTGHPAGEFDQLCGDQRFGIYQGFDGLQLKAGIPAFPYA